VTSLLEGESNVGGIEFNRETVFIDIGLYIEVTVKYRCVIGPSEDTTSLRVKSKSLVSLRTCLQVDMMLRACAIDVSSCRRQPRGLVAPDAVPEGEYHCMYYIPNFCWKPVKWRMRETGLLMRTHAGVVFWICVAYACEEVEARPGPGAVT
jgi:hypothetical protein